jgi:putative acetyltransferase
VIRPAEAGDEAGIRAVHLAAFPTRAEADLVERLDSDGDAVLSLVAERSGEIVAHVLLSRMSVSGEGRDYRALGLGPIAVTPAFQRASLGSELIRSVIAIAQATSEELIFVLGEPEYYSRFGFSADTAAPFLSPYAGRYLMALALREVALPGIGEAEYAPAFRALV